RPPCRRAYSEVQELAEEFWPESVERKARSQKPGLGRGFREFGKSRKSRRAPSGRQSTPFPAAVGRWRFSRPCGLCPTQARSTSIPAPTCSTQRNRREPPAGYKSLTEAPKCRRNRPFDFRIIYLN